MGMADPAGLSQPYEGDNVPPCRCGRIKHCTEPVGINDTIHEPYAMDEGFCGPRLNHEIRDAHIINGHLCNIIDEQVAKVAALSEEVCGSACVKDRAQLQHERALSKLWAGQADAMQTELKVFHSPDSWGVSDDGWIDWCGPKELLPPGILAACADNEKSHPYRGKKQDGYHAMVAMRAKLREAESLLIALRDEWWPYVHDACTIESRKALFGKITDYFASR